VACAPSEIDWVVVKARAGAGGFAATAGVALTAAEALPAADGVGRQHGAGVGHPVGQAADGERGCCSGGRRETPGRAAAGRCSRWIAAPPSEVGAANETLMLASPAVAATADGTPGGHW